MNTVALPRGTANAVLDRMFPAHVPASMVDYPWPRSGRFIPHSPHEGPQTDFVRWQGLEAFYGGAAGGGKSDALLMAALQYVDVPGYAALLMRKTYTELMLENALLDRAAKWLSHTTAKWQGDAMRWRFPSGATLTFGYMRNLQDRARYQSAEFQFIGFDELTAFAEADYRFMFSRLRKVENVDVPLRMRGASNPGGPGHRWTKKRLVDAATRKDGVRFFPARLPDNPSIHAESYMKSLGEMEPEMIAQLLDGDWDAREQGNWMIGDHRWLDASVALGERMWDEGVLDPDLVVDGQRGLVQAIDWGEHSAGYLVWALPGGGVFIPPSEVYVEHTDPAITSKRLLDEAEQHEWPLVHARYDSAGVQSMRTYLGLARRREGLARLRSTGIPFNRYKRESIGYLRTLLRRTWAGETVRVIGIHPDNEMLIEQLHDWRRKGPETDDAVKERDHAPDALIAGIAPIARAYRDFIERELADSYGETDNAYLEDEGDADEGSGPGLIVRERT